MTILAIIPCHNEAKYIYSVVTQSTKHVQKVIVIDNLSTDSTTSEAVRAGASAICCTEKGMGNATRRGIVFALANGADAVVTLDGDGQHVPDEIPELMAPVQSRLADLVIGIRADKDAMPVYRRFGNWVIGIATNLGASVQVADAQCGFRALSREAMLVPLVSPGFGCVTELIIKARKRGLRLVQVPVSCIYHANTTENSTMNPVKHGVLVLLKTVRWRVWEHLGI